MKIKKSQTPNDDFAVNLNRTLRFLSFRPRSEKEIIDYLKKKKVSTTTAKKIVDKLKENKFLNDEEFARWFIDQRTKNSKRALRIINLELKQKGISEQIRESIFNNPELKIQNDLEMAKEIVEKRISRYKDLSKQEIYEKLGRYLSSKGFSWEVIKKSIDEKFSK